MIRSIHPVGWMIAAAAVEVSTTVTTRNATVLAVCHLVEPPSCFVSGTRRSSLTGRPNGARSEAPPPWFRLKRQVSRSELPASPAWGEIRGEALGNLTPAAALPPPRPQSLHPRPPPPQSPRHLSTFAGRPRRSNPRKSDSVAQNILGTPREAPLPSRLAPVEEEKRKESPLPKCLAAGLEMSEACPAPGAPREPSRPHELAWRSTDTPPASERSCHHGLPSSEWTAVSADGTVPPRSRRAPLADPSLTQHGCSAHPPTVSFCASPYRSGSP